MIISKIVSYICGVNSLSVFFKTNVGIPGGDVAANNEVEMCAGGFTAF